MKLNEFSKPVTLESLNETLAKRYGTKIDTSKFTIEQLLDARNRLRTQLSQVETNESYDTVSNDETYQKNKLFLDVINAAIAEREELDEKAKPDYIDIDGDGDKKEPMKKAVKDKKKKAPVKEGAEEQAALTMAAKDMVDRVTGWMEDTAEMQTESMLELADAIRDEMGSEASEAFTSLVKPALESMYGVMETTRGTLTQGVGQLTGEAEPMDTMGAEDPAADPEMEPTVDADDEGMPVDSIEDPEDDGMGAADAAAGGEELGGREKRESVERSKKKSLKA